MRNKDWLLLVILIALLLLGMLITLLWGGNTSRHGYGGLHRPDIPPRHLLQERTAAQGTAPGTPRRASGVLVGPGRVGDDRLPAPRQPPGRDRRT